MGDSVRIEVRNARDAIAPASEAAESWLGQHQVGPEATYLVLLAIEELVTNCIKYAYDDAGEHIITILLSIADRTLKMEVIDDGHPFDPLTAPEPDLALDLKDREQGGLGIFMLRQLSDGMAYERRDGTNRLTLTKWIS